jgi:membrane protein YdbS with pleckstrin-like domain
MTAPPADEIFRIVRPDPKLLRLYLVRCVLTGPFFPILVIPHLIRYHTLRYRFDAEGIGVTVGVLFRKESYITYSRMQDIHLSRGILERWFGLGSVEVQTAAGSSEAEIKIEGLTRFNEVRDYLYSRMRGGRDLPAAGAKSGGESGNVLVEIRDELRALREALEKRGGV